ncbi:uncharacterized protein LOC135838972 [Planococcus citri]|uniref:uncharacterized protein LOC135838972 n=1 Tax=Planococcus citri TaxID=170843 RepID=UPI0031F7AD50
MEVLKCVFIQPGILILINFIFVSRALSKETELFGFYPNTTISSFEINEDEDEFFFRTFEYVAIHTLAVVKSVIGFHDELSAEIKEIKDEKIKRLENKIKQLEENDGRSEEEISSIDEEQLFDLEIFNTTSVKSDVYDEHEFRRSYYSRKMPDVFRLIKSNQKLIDKMQSVKNEIAADRFVSNYIRTKQTSSESKLETLREVVLKLMEKQVPPKNIRDYARSAIDSINLIIEQHRERFNSIINEMDDKIHLLNERIRELEENKPSKSSQHTTHEEL